MTEQLCFTIIQFSVLKSIEFPHNTNSHLGEEESKDALNCPTPAHSKPLDVLIRERNKVLQSENTTPKVGNSELQGKRPLINQQFNFLNKLKSNQGKREGKQ